MWSVVVSHAVQPVRSTVASEATICGRGHANMLARVKAVPVAEFQQWLADQKQAIDAANKAAAAARKTQSPLSQGNE